MFDKFAEVSGGFDVIIESRLALFTSGTGDVFDDIALEIIKALGVDVIPGFNATLVVTRVELGHCQSGMRN